MSNATSVLAFLSLCYGPLLATVGFTVALAAFRGELSPVEAAGERGTWGGGIPLFPDLDGEAVEACCFCRVPSLTWTALPERTGGEQVACCAACAAHATPEQVPSKLVWIERETIAGLQSDPRT